MDMTFHTFRTTSAVGEPTTPLWRADHRGLSPQEQNQQGEVEETTSTVRANVINLVTMRKIRAPEC